MRLSPGLRALTAAILCALVLGTLMCVRAALEARAERARAQTALRQGDYESAILHLRRSARWGAPGNVYASASLVSLENLAHSLETRGQVQLALAANRAIHAAIHGSRGFTGRDGPRLSRADARIAALLSGEPAPEIDASKSQAERRALFLELLRGREPNLFWVLFAVAGSVTWVVAGAVFLLRGVDPRGRVVRRVARRSGFVLLLGWIAFALGLRLA